MLSQWSDRDAQQFIERYAGAPHSNQDVALRVYTSRLIGRDPALVLHGGGNTSVKTQLADDVGEIVDVLCVKGSGWDLGDIEPRGLPALRLKALLALQKLPALNDEQMVNAQRVRMLDASGPNPSVETLLHAFLPHKFIDHSHADAILAIVDQPDSERLCKELYGDRFALVPYIMPGFQLAKLAAEIHAASPHVEGLLLVRHGLFTFADTARESYERHIRAVDVAEQFIASKKDRAVRRAPADVDFALVAPVLRGALGEKQRAYVLELRAGEKVRAFVDRVDLDQISQRGTATPDHVIRTKRVPLLLDPSPLADEAAAAEHIAQRVAAFRTAYGHYVDQQMARRKSPVKKLDADPRIVLVPGLGLIGVGATKKAAQIAADVYEHTIDVIDAAERIGTYHVLDESNLFDMEYWSLEQAKLGSAKPKPLEGRIVYITGAARGLGAAIAQAFAAQGAQLYLVDRELETLAQMAKGLGAAYEAFDITNEDAVAASMRRCVHTFGGLDGIVSNAGTAPQGKMHDATEALKQSLAINLLSHQHVAAAATRVLRAQGMGGFLLFNASKSAFNPGPDFGPYSVPKAGVIALMKQYAVENGAQGIRANAVNADRIRTGLLPAHELAERARARGLVPDDYYLANLLAREVTAGDVADAFVYLALARSTTGCTITVDGGNIAASPR
jgi:rhamnose utilization protein RhaD (predicted bifunctional aldolase and dehydrogenase)/NAD(P)-dependent dehydrogenase (short-subunit alcohol dehydrogenase family)